MIMREQLVLRREHIQSTMRGRLVFENMYTEITYTTV